MLFPVDILNKRLPLHRVLVVLFQASSPTGWVTSKITLGHGGECSSSSGVGHSSGDPLSGLYYQTQSPKPNSYRKRNDSSQATELSLQAQAR